MKEIVLASQNPVKIQACLNGFYRMFPDQEFHIRTVSVPSQVKEQPTSDEETMSGAYNRAYGASQKETDADFWVGIEGGVDTQNGEVNAFAWVVVLGKDRLGKGRTGTFFLPKAVADLVRQGKELGEADDILFRRTNSKQENGAVGILTNDVIDRSAFYEQAVVLALIPFKNPLLYPALTLD